MCTWVLLAELMQEIELGSELSDESEEEPTDGDDSSLSDLVAAAEDAKEVAGDAVEADADAAKEVRPLHSENHGALQSIC